MVESGEKFSYDFIDMGVLKGHSDRVSCLAAGHCLKEDKDTPLLISGSRDNTLIIWKLYNDNVDGYYGVPQKTLNGHNHFVSDLALANENNMVISSSWDTTLRLWDLNTGKTMRRFVGHTKEVYTVALSQNNRQILSAGADKVIKLWNTLGDCKFTTKTHNHSDWVSCIRYSTAWKTYADYKPYFASAGWDGRLKIWNTNFQLRGSIKAHKGNINALGICPNFKYVATGGKDKLLNIWDVMDMRATRPRIQYNDADSTINQISFNSKLTLVAAATDNDIKIWNPMTLDNKSIADLLHDPANKEGF